MLYLEQTGGFLCLAEEFCMQMGVTLFSSKYADFRIIRIFLKKYILWFWKVLEYIGYDLSLKRNVENGDLI